MRISATNDGRLKVQFRYNRAAVEQLKQTIPWRERQWSPPDKSWLVTPSKSNNHAILLVDKTFFSGQATIPQTVGTLGTPFNETITVRYIGIPKDVDGTMQSSGMLHYMPDNEFAWLVVFPEDVLKSWFIPGYVRDGTKTTAPKSDTLYSILAVMPDADLKTLKRGYRKAAKTWHPDINSDPTASDKFREIDNAYKMLRDPQKRMRYDAGLALAKTVARPTRSKRWYVANQSDWRPPIRCGQIVCSGKKIGELYHIAHITGWSDIVGANGQSMVTSWPYGNTKPHIDWV